MPPESDGILVDGERLPLPAAGVTLAALLFSHGRARGVLCAMGSCYGCLVDVAGRGTVRACCLPCTPGLEVRTRAP